MIIVLHIMGCLTSSWLCRKSKEKEIVDELWDGKLWTPGESHYIQEGQQLIFNPPCYIQRYQTVTEFLNEEKNTGSIARIVEFGCAELSYFLHLKRISEIAHVVEVDIDEEVLLKNSSKAEPLTYDYIYGSRTTPLHVKVCQGSVTDYDPCLEDTDIVIAIELIEHLELDVLAGVPENIFGRICPRIALFTTPNVEFNQLFPNFCNQMRHYDHKFEWTRAEFQQWALDIVTKYPCYSVKLYGIGPGPEGTEHLGCCSQMAVFRRSQSYHISKSVKNAATKYKVILESEFPYKEDSRTVAEKVFDETVYRVRHFKDERFYNEDTYMYEIPLDLLLPFVSEHCSHLSQLRSILVDNGQNIIGEVDPKIVVMDDRIESDTEPEVEEYEDYVVGPAPNDIYEDWDVQLKETEKLIEDRSDILPEIKPRRKRCVEEEVDAHTNDSICLQETQRPYSVSPDWWSSDGNHQSKSISEIQDCYGDEGWEQASYMNQESGDKKCWENSRPESLSPMWLPNEVVEGRYSSARLAKSFSLDSCLENINCERGQVQTMYLSMQSRAHTIESGSPSERGPDSGYPMSFSQDLSEQADLGMSDESLSAGEGYEVPPPRPQPLNPLPVENGDLANNNRDGEGNNVEGIRNPLPPPFLREEFPPWLLHLLWIEPQPAVQFERLDEGLGDDSGSELSDSPAP